MKGVERVAARAVGLSPGGGVFGLGHDEALLTLEHRARGALASAAAEQDEEEDHGVIPPAVWQASQVAAAWQLVQEAGSICASRPCTARKAGG